MLVNRKMQAATGARVGAKVRICLEPDLEERAAIVPAELAMALKGEKRLRRWFDGLPTAMRRDVGKWVMEPKSLESRRNRAEQTAEWLMLTMEGEKELPPVIEVAFRSVPAARKGWEAMTATQRRSNLLAVFYYQGPEAREKRVRKLVEDCLKVAGK